MIKTKTANSSFACAHKNIICSCLLTSHSAITEQTHRWNCEGKVPRFQKTWWKCAKNYGEEASAVVTGTGHAGLFPSAFAHRLMPCDVMSIAENKWCLYCQQWKVSHGSKIIILWKKNTGDHLKLLWTCVLSPSSLYGRKTKLLHCFNRMGLLF